MPKIKTSFSLSQETLDLLKLLSEKDKRSMASMLEVLVEQAAKKEKIKTL